MSRTYKDKPTKTQQWHKEQELLWENNIVYTAEFIDSKGNIHEIIRRTCVKRAGILTKKRKEQDTEYHWMSTPSAWTRLMMNRPQRRAGHMWERSVLFEEDLEETDPPGVSRKPHLYYW